MKKGREKSLKIGQHVGQKRNLNKKKERITKNTVRGKYGITTQINHQLCAPVKRPLEMDIDEKKIGLPIPTQIVLEERKMRKSSGTQKE